MTDMKQGICQMCKTDHSNEEQSEECIKRFCDKFFEVHFGFSIECFCHLGMRIKNAAQTDGVSTKYKRQQSVLHLGIEDCFQPRISVVALGPIGFPWRKS